MALPKYIEIDGKWIAWRDLLKLRHEQKKSAQKSQLTLFEMRDDTRPKSQQTASGRFSEPTLIDE